MHDFYVGYISTNLSMILLMVPNLLSFCLIVSQHSLLKIYTPVSSHLIYKLGRYLELVSLFSLPFMLPSWRTNLEDMT